MRREYTRRRDICCRAVEKYLPSEVVEFSVPAAGMFFWIKVRSVRNRQGTMRGNVDTGFGERVFSKCVEEGVLLVPGDVFRAEIMQGGDGVEGEVYFRGTFAAVRFDELEIGIQRFGKALRDIFGLPPA